MELMTKNGKGEEKSQPHVHSYVGLWRREYNLYITC